MTEPGRNDPCPCGSGKKYKKCCAIKPASRGFKAEVITEKKETQVKPVPLSSLFEQNVTQNPPKPTHKKEEEKLDM